jgi:hypothetical protein
LIKTSVSGSARIVSVTVGGGGVVGLGGVLGGVFGGVLGVFGGVFVGLPVASWAKVAEAVTNKTTSRTGAMQTGSLFIRSISFTSGGIINNRRLNRI